MVQPSHHSHATWSWVFVVALFALVVQVEPTLAQAGATEDEAKESFARGLDLAREERWDEAAAAFERARAITPRPSVLFNLASVRYRLGQLVESREVLRQYLDAAHDREPNYEEALRLRGVLEQDIPILTLAVAPESAEVFVDGKPDTARGLERSLAVDPGEHQIEVRARDHVPQTLSLNLERTARVRRQVELQRQALLDVHPQPRAATESTAVLEKKDDDGGGLLSSPVFWVTTALVIGGGVATALLLTGGHNSRPADATGGTTGVKLTAPGGK